MYIERSFSTVSLSQRVLYRRFYCIIFLYCSGQKEARESREVQPDEVELKVGGVRVIPLCDEESAKETIMLRTASGYETAAQFLKQCLYGDRHKRIPG